MFDGHDHADFEQELLVWAYSSEGEPMQDWDLMVTDPNRAELLLRLAADPSCPQRGFFLRCLYLLVGEYIRVSSAGLRVAPSIEPLLTKAAALSDPAIQTWVKRSWELLAHPDLFDYSFWCDGGFAHSSE